MRSSRPGEGRNEARRRVQNEWTSNAAGSFSETFVCECGDPACTATIELTRDEYEQVRSRSNWFAIARDHENPEAEVVLREHDRYTLVSKVAEALQIARASDPRINVMQPVAES
jgi:hypothetical protein